MGLYKFKLKKYKSAMNINQIRKINRKYKKIKLVNKEYLNIFQILIDSIPSPIFYKDDKGVYKACNESFAEFLGYSKKNIIGYTAYDVSPSELAEVYHNADLELMNKRGRQVYETQVKHSDGTNHDVIIAKNTLINSNGKVYGLVGVMFDITERKKSEKRVNRLLKVKEAMLEVSHAISRIDSINMLYSLILDKAIESIENASKGSVLLIDKNENLKIVAYKGYEEEYAKKFYIKLKDSFIWKKTKGCLKSSVIINDIDRIEDEADTEILEQDLEHKTKSVICAPITIEERLYGIISIDSIETNVFDDTDLEIMNYLSNQVEISISKHKLYEDIIYLSRHDKLTGLYNRSYFEEIFYTTLKRSVGNNEKFSLIIFDLDNLKTINDKYGHLAGDKYIKTAAYYLSKSIRNTDVLGRVGGDEFSAICLEGNDEILKKRFDTLLEKLRQSPVEFEGNKIICSFSYGISNFPIDGVHYRDIIKIADERMYEHKKRNLLK